MLVDDDAAYHYRAGCEFNGEEHRVESTVAIHRYWTDGSDEPTFAWVVEMQDGSFWFVDGWHDYTGWDCRSGIEFHAAESLDDAIRLAPDDVRREWQESK